MCCHSLLSTIMNDYKCSIYLYQNECRHSIAHVHEHTHFSLSNSFMLEMVMFAYFIWMSYSPSLLSCLSCKEGAGWRRENGDLGCYCMVFCICCIVPMPLICDLLKWCMDYRKNLTTQDVCMTKSDRAIAKLVRHTKTVILFLLLDIQYHVEKDHRWRLEPLPIYKICFYHNLYAKVDILFSSRACRSAIFSVRNVSLADI